MLHQICKRKEERNEGGGKYGRKASYEDKR